MLTKSELKAWTDALRSGKYIQGQEKLKGIHFNGEASYCCLGVLCEIQELPQTQLNSTVSFCGASTYLPDILTLKVGSDEGSFEKLGMPPLNGFNSVAQANDEGVSFAEIADHLDKYYPAEEDK